MTKSILLTAIIFMSVEAFAQNKEIMKSINKEAPVKNSKSITINASSEKVWLLLTNINNWPAWQTDVVSSKLNGNLEPRATFNWKSGGVKIHSTLHTVNPNFQIGWTGKSLGILAVHNWTLTENGNATMVNVEESMEGFLAVLFKKSLNKKLEMGLNQWLELLKQESESRN